MLPTTALALRRRGPGARDAHGALLPGALGDPLGPWPARASERADGTWVLSLDPAAWPARVGDLVFEPGTGRQWLVQGQPDLITHPVDPSVDFVRVEGHLRLPGGTLP